MDPHVVVLEDDLELRSLVTRGLREEGFRVTSAGTAAEVLALVDGPTAGRAGGGHRPAGCRRSRCRAGAACAGADDAGDLPHRARRPHRPPLGLRGGWGRLPHEAVCVRGARGPAPRAREAGRRRPGRAGRQPDARSEHARPSCDGTTIDLTPTEFRLLARLAAKPGSAVRRRQLVEAGWAHGAIVHDNTLDVYIARLRRKLEPLPGAPEIATVHGVGYSLR